MVTPKGIFPYDWMPWYTSLRHLFGIRTNMASLVADYSSSGESDDIDSDTVHEV